MKSISKTLAVAIVAASLPVIAAAAAAPAAAQVVQGIAVANPDAVIYNSSAFTTAEQQRQTTYKPQFDAAQQRGTALEAQLKPLVDKFTADRAAANPNQTALQQQAQRIQQMQQAGQEELQRMLQPVALSRAYVEEQIREKLDQAVKSAMTKKRISLVLDPSAIVAVNDNAYNLNQDILNELNTLLPSAQLVPPQGWEPRQIREARAAQAQQQAPQPQPAQGNQASGGSR